MSADREVPEVPGFTDDDLRETLLANYGAGADSELPDDVRFLAGVAKLLRKIDGGKSPAERSSVPAVFILSDGPPDAVEPSELTTVPMLNNGLTPIEGFIWFVGPAVNYGHGLAVEACADAEVFGRVTSVGAGAARAVFYDPRTEAPEARYFPNGLDDPDDYHDVRLGGTSITLDEILRVVDQVHKAQLITSTAQSSAGKLWANASRHWPAEDAEAIIQLYLKSGLITAFPSCVIRDEQTQVTGRLDIEIEEPDVSDRSVVTRHAILELKVLREFGSKGARYPHEKVEEWVREGVNQAHDYREERGSRASALCCFDMRSTHTAEACFTHVRGIADTLEVRLRVWHIFPNPRALREHRAAQRG